MSTILKALRRLEDDKAAGQPVSLEESIVTPAEAMRASRRGGVLVGVASGVGVLLLGLGAFIWLGPQAPGDVALEAASPTPEPRRTAVVPEASETRQQRAAMPALERLPKAIAPAQPDLLAAREIAATAPPSSPPPALRPAAKPSELSAGGGRRAQSEAQTFDPEPLAASEISSPSSAADSEPKLEDLPLGSPERRAARPLPKVAAPAPVPPSDQPAPARVASIGPVEIVERAPKLTFVVTQTVWHPSPSRRLAVIELESGETKRLGEGEEIRGFTVGKIGLANVEFLRGDVSIEKRVGSR